MKRYALFFTTLLCALSFNNNWVYAAPIIKPNHSSIIKKKIDKKPLMASHLSKQLLKNFNLTTPLSYARGHEFYDTPIELQDDEGNKVVYKHQVKSKKNYTLLSVGQITLATDNIWFFSPNGSEQEFENEYDWYKCIAENPCKNITQRLIDDIHIRARNANLWFATGVYDLPLVKQRKHQPKLIELHDNQNIMGRTSDFRHFAYDKDRPLFLGTLSWNDYSIHGGITASVDNIIMQTTDNVAQVGDLFVNTNLHSTGTIRIWNSKLEKTLGTNINAQNIMVSESNLIGLGASATNLIGGSISVLGSYLKSEGKNIEAYSARQTWVDVSESNLLVENNLCGGVAIGLNGENISGQFRSSNIIIKSKGECKYSGEITTAIGLSGIKELWPTLLLWDSKINVFSENGSAIGLLIGSSFLKLYNSQIGHWY
jgi:hypothetical protein